MLYFVQQGKSGPIKIGITRGSMQTRLGDLQVGNPCTLRCLATMDGGDSLENLLHMKFHTLHLRGEWFRPKKPLIEFIRQNGTSYKPKATKTTKYFLEEAKESSWVSELLSSFSKGVSV